MMMFINLSFSNNLKMPNVEVPKQTWRDVYKTNLEIKNKIQRLFKKKQYKKCINLIDFYFEDRDGRKSYKDLLYKRSYSYLKLKNYTQSLFYFNDLVQRFPKFRDAWYNRASLLKSMKKPNEALESYDKALEVNNKIWWIHYDRAILLILMKKDLMAMIALKRVLFLKANSAWTLFELGNISYRQKKYVNALNYYLKAKKIKSKISGLNTRISFCKKKILQE